jgi:hypothetical protein
MRDPLRRPPFGNVALNGDRLDAAPATFGDDFVRFLGAREIIDDDVRARFGKS